MHTTKNLFLVANVTKTGYLVIGTDGVPFEFSRRAIETGIVTGMFDLVEPTWAVLQWRMPS
jgi:hypothetical protein